VSLRARLTLATLAIVAVGLLAAGLATYGLMRSFLLDGVDQQLRASRFAAARTLRVGPDLPFALADDEDPSITAGTWTARACYRPRTGGGSPFEVCLPLVGRVPVTEPDA